MKNEFLSLYLLYIHKSDHKMKIQEFSFENFKSFKELNTLNFAASSLKSKVKCIDNNNVIHGRNDENVSFLKTKAIYGANASGKSKIVEAFLTFATIIQNSVKNENVLNNIEPFRLSTETENSPSFFQIIFWEDEVKYRYGFEASKEKIFSEWLFAKPNKREIPYFIRDNDSLIKLDETNFSEGQKVKALFMEDQENLADNEIFRNNSLFLSTLASFGFGKLSKKIINSISSVFIVNGLGHSGLYEHAGKSLADEEKKRYMLKLLKYGDLGIQDLSNIELTSEGLSEEADLDFKKNLDDKKIKLLISDRKKYDENLNYKANAVFSLRFDESEGTRKLFELSPIIYSALKEERPLIIDEFDARFHPLLTKKIVELFNSAENKGAQLVFITHDTNLLSSDLLRRDQIEFVEKDKYGASHLYSLAEFKGVRNDAKFEKDYIQGKYGAIPFLGNFNEIFREETHA